MARFADPGSSRTKIDALVAGHEVPLGALAYPPHDGDEAAADVHGPWVTRIGQRTRFLRVPAAADAATAALRELVEREALAA